jgi:hypothetical protein
MSWVMQFRGEIHSGKSFKWFLRKKKAGHKTAVVRRLPKLKKQPFRNIESVHIDCM